MKYFLPLLLSLLSLPLAAAPAPGPADAKKPNILLIVADDLTFRDIEPYGNSQVRTPNLARLAKEGMCLDNMFTSSAMCAPSRQQLYTGMYPVRNGAYPNHSQVYPGTKSVAHHLQSLGYATALLGKRHYGPEASFPFEYLGGRDHDGGEGQDIDLQQAAAFMQRSAGKPYFLVVTSNQPHGPLNRGNPAAYPAAKMKVPAGLVDTKETRRELSHYYAEISYLDSLVGVCLKMVEQSGQQDNTLVLFTSEQGSGFPFAKWTCYDSGLKTAFIARWPGHIKAGSRSGAMAQYVDLVPTLIELAGGDPASFKTGRKDARGQSGFDGQSFKKVLLGQTGKLRSYVFGVHTTRGIIKGSEAYPIRSARSDKYLYIHNLNHEQPFSNVVTNGALYRSWLETGKPRDQARALWYVQRPAEELYDVEKDPYQLTNLAGQPALQAVQKELKAQLAAWMQQQGDLGLETEMQAFARMPGKEGQEPGSKAAGGGAGAKKKKKAAQH
ncbi:MAG: sulfatase [Adhaeribacter sp.]